MTMVVPDTIELAEHPKSVEHVKPQGIEIVKITHHQSAFFGLFFKVDERLRYRNGTASVHVSPIDVPIKGASQEYVTRFPNYVINQFNFIPMSFRDEDTELVEIV